MHPALTREESLLIGDIYDAAMDGALWPRVLGTVADMCSVDRIMMPYTDVLNPASNMALAHNIEMASLDEWRREGHDATEVDMLSGWLADAGLDVPWSSDDVFGGPEGYRRAAGAYYELLTRNGVRRQLGMLFEHGGHRFAAIGLNNYDPFPAHTTAVLLRLAPHLRRAMEVHRQLSRVRQENRQLYRMLDAMLTGVVLVDGHERVRYANPEAVRQIRQHGGISMLRERLQIRDDKGKAVLAALVHKVISTSQREGSADGGGVVGLPSPEAGHSLTVSVMPLSELADWQDLRSDHIAAVLFMTEANGEHRLPENALQDLYGLTPREVSVCRAFLNTPELDELADELGLALGTVRSVMKSVYQKTEQPSQAKLMRLLMEIKLNFRHL